MRILLVATNQTDRYMDRMAVRPLPIGLAYIAAAVDEDRHDLRLIDLMFSEDGAADAEAAAREFQPDLVGLSIRNLDNHSSLNSVWNLPRAREIAARVRGACDAVILCGGPAFSILPAECLDYVGADVGIAGDAAEAFALLVERLESGDDYADVPGVVYRRDDGRIEVGNGRFTSDFHRAPRLDLLDMRRYNGSGFGVGVVTKLAPRYYPAADTATNGDDWRIRAPEEVIDEVRSLNRDYGIDKVFFIDSGFNIPPDHAKTLCNALIDSDVKLRWNSYIRPGAGDEELMRLMRESGCSLALLSESGGGGDLGERLNAIGVMASMCGEAGLPFALNMSFGEPGESAESVRMKLSLLTQVEPAFAALRLGTRVLPNTAAAKRALEEGMIESESDLLKPVFYIEPNVRGWLGDRLKAEAADRPRWNLS